MSVSLICAARISAETLAFLMISLPSADAICTGKQLGQVIGKTSRQVERLAASGILKPVRCKLKGSRRYRLSAAVQAYLAYREKYVTERLKLADDGYNKARARRMEALAGKEELSLAAKRGEYLYKPDVEFHFSMLLRNCRDRILAIPSRVMYELAGQTNPRKCNLIVGTECDLALNEIADRKCFDWERIRREIHAYMEGQGFPPETAEETAEEMVNRSQNRNGERPLTGAEKKEITKLAEKTEDDFEQS
jgi:hypothetical protein